MSNQRKPKPAGLIGRNPVEAVEIIRNGRALERAVIIKPTPSTERSPLGRRIERR